MGGGVLLYPSELTEESTHQQVGAQMLGWPFEPLEAAAGSPGGPESRRSWWRGNAGEALRVPPHVVGEKCGTMCFKTL